MQVSAKDGDEAMACRGCAAKLPAESLAAALADAGLASLGTSPQDAVLISSEASLLQSVDGFPALVSDPWLNGRLTALHACSDLWASGARTTSAMAVITLPATELRQQQQLLGQTLAGICSALEQQGASLIGGHTLEARHAAPLPDSLGVQVSLSVNGTAPRIWSKQGMQAGDVLLLSGPLGTGVLFAAAMSGAADPHHLDAALQRMSQSQHPLVEQLLDLGDALHACTDITGFGLLGHLGEMLAGSDMLVALDATAIPAYDGVLELFGKGLASTLAPANRRALTLLDRSISLTGQSSSGLLELLVDPQTCGPLLVSCSKPAAMTLISQGPWTQIGSA
jgi:selenide,water dikinase